MVEDRVSLQQLVYDLLFGKTTEKCFTFFMGWKVRHVS